ncbi:Lactosylceramide 4-alpha-galactosyltransferase [Chionoecetes opilio]|uniref:Lactosylceramide 4-alpha-galactosyltransferase n=1 Tax=Chionoecetes opilio TaxID=41210 RepID=A0A8J4Z1C7_CHIOP|nr:Lactosylceramide 4-alpha-galactosyltransferase [Chionoecetes opilio]
MLFRDITPEMNNNIFLMDTSCNPFPNERVWCSVESWARQNPDRQVWFLLTSGQLEGGHALTSLLLQQYTNIHLVTADVMDLFKDTPLLSLLNSRRWTEVNTWPIELMSDMLRVLVLWWWGGVYSDTDVISLRALTLPPNSLGFEDPYLIGSAFYSFRARHPTLLKLMEDMQLHFEPWSWGSIGPAAISRVIISECGKTLPELIQESPVTCPGNITLHPTSTFFPVPFNEFEKYFSPGGGKDFDEEQDEDDTEDEDEDDMELESGADFREIKARVPSLRMDAILKSGLNMSRNKVESAFYASKIRINGKKLLKKSNQCREGDEIDVFKTVSKQNPKYLYVSRVVVVTVGTMGEDDDKVTVKLRRYPNLLVECYQDFKAPEQDE